MAIYYTNNNILIKARSAYGELKQKMLEKKTRSIVLQAKSWPEEEG